MDVMDIQVQNKNSETTRRFLHMYGLMNKAKYLALGLMALSLMILSGPDALAQTTRGSLGESGSRAGTAGASELLVPMTARTTALAGATSSGMADMGGVEALFSNPAGLSLTSGTEAMFSRVDYVADIGVNYLALAQSLGANSSIAFTVTSWDFGDLPTTTVDAPENSNVTFDVSYLTAGLSFARQLTDRIAAGVTMKIVSEKIADANASTIAWDAGMTYVVGESGLRLGVSLKNMGGELSFAGNGLVQQVNLPGQEPTANANTLMFESSGVQLPTLLNFGATYTTNVGASSAFTFLGNFRSNSFDQDQYSFAIEYGFQELFYLRGGYIADEGVEESFFKGASYGAGLNLGLGGTSSIRIDYTIVPTDFFDDVQYITVTLDL
jgi:hypothetical protein